MSCSHTEECPLFPLLNASVGGWRNCYCDSENGWRDCARYQLSLSGRRVPITLLPNGKDAAHLGREAARAGEAQPQSQSRAAPRQPPPTRPHPGQAPRPYPGQAPRPQAGPAQATIPRPPVDPASAPARPARPAPARAAQPPAPPRVQPAQPAPQASGSRRPWWTRFVDWMRAAS